MDLHTCARKLFGTTILLYSFFSFADGENGTNGSNGSNGSHGTQERLGTERIRIVDLEAVRAENIQNMQRFSQNIELSRERMNIFLVDQEGFTDAILDLWRDVNLGIRKNHRSLLLVGPRGVGKTFGVGVFVKSILGGSQERVLAVSASALNSEKGMNDFLGSGENPGMLKNFLVGEDEKGTPASRGAVIVFEDIDEASLRVHGVLEELLKKGYLEDEDKIFPFRNILFVFTSRVGAEDIYPSHLERPFTRAERAARLKNFDDEKIKKLFFRKTPGNRDEEWLVYPKLLEQMDRAIGMPPPSLEAILNYSRLYMANYSQDYFARRGINFIFTPEIYEHIIKYVYIPSQGIDDLEQRLEKLFVIGLDTLLKQVKNLRPTDKFTLHCGEPCDGNFIIREELGDIEIPIKVNDKAFLPPEGPFSGPEAEARLRNLNAVLKESVIGQDDAMDMIDIAVVSKLHKKGKKPIRLLGLGPTGIGKTKTGKTLAKAAYGSKEKFISFDMGRIKNHFDFANIFGAPAGTVGSGEISAFERFLKNNPEGAVCMFDEIGNMGDVKDPSVKQDLLTFFYKILDEGEWTNQYGVRYDLRNFTFAFSSNEFQEDFFSDPSDDLRISTWKELNKIDVIRERLKTKYGWPEALLGRMGPNIFLYKPLTAEDRIKISRQMIQELAEEFSFFGKSEFRFDEKFYKILSTSFFSHSRGARALEDLSEGALSYLVTKVLMDKEILKKHSFGDMVFTFDLEDNYFEQTRYSGDTPPERNVKLKLTLQDKQGKEIKVSHVDLSGVVPTKRLASDGDLMRTAYHEVGHVLVNDPHSSGEVVDHVTIRGEGGYLGYARYVDIKPPRNYDRDALVSQVARLLAGREAEIKMGLPYDSGWTSDWERARKYAARAVTEWGLAEPFNIPVDAEGKIIKDSELVSKEITGILMDAQALAKKRLDENEHLFFLLTNALLKKEFLERAEIEAIYKEAAAWESAQQLRQARRADILSSIKKELSSCQGLLTSLLL